MQVRCQNCRIGYLVDDAAAIRGVRARCPSCQHVQVVSTALPSEDEGGPPSSVPLSTPSGRKSHIGKLSLKTRTVQKTPEKKEEGPEELFGELEWETETELEYVVGRSEVPLDSPSPPPVPPPVAPLISPLARGHTSAPVDWTEVRAEYEATESSRASGPRTDEWPEDEQTDPWRNTPLPPLAAVTPPPALGPVTLPAPPTPPEPVTPPAAVGFRPAPRPGPSTPVPASPSPTPTPRPEAPGPVATPQSCAACGGSLVDADDRASGVCGGCRQRAAAALHSFRSAPSAVLPEVEPIPPTPTPRRELPAARGRGRPRTLVLLSLLAVVVGAGAALWWARSRSVPINLPPLPNLRPSRTPQPPAGTLLPEGLEARLNGWQSRADEPRLPAELLAGGWRDFGRDTGSGYADAKQALQAALVKNPRDTEALGLWLSVQALAYGTQFSDSELGALVRLGETALERLNRHPALLAGTAEVLLARGRRPDLAQAQTLAQEAVDAAWPRPAAGRKGPPPKPPDGPPRAWSAPVRVTLADTYAGTSAGLALSALQEAEQQDPTLRRIWNVRAAAHVSAGNFRAAVADLQARLKLDPDHPVTLAALARLWGEVGETAPARKIYERLQADRRTQDGPAVVDMAELRATAEKNLPEAVKLLGTAVTRGRLSGDELRDAQIALARLARAAGETGTASSAASAAVRIAPENPRAHVQALLVELDRAAPAAAAAHLPTALAGLEDPGLAALLEGRVRAAEGRWQLAGEAFERAVEADPRRTDARLWAGAAWATAGDRNRALHAVALALEADPFRSGPGVPPLWPGDGLKGAADRLAQLSKEDQDSLPLLAESVLRFHQGDTAAAEQGLDRILKSGARQPLPLAWKSVAAGARGDPAEALSFARQAVAQGRTSGFAQFALGSALLATGDLEGARRALREAQTLAPGLLAAQVRLAEVEARTGAVASARERLQRVIVLDPEYASARRALYLLPPES